jgi:serine phosphatase RsbU (regulator of sigma subunit)
MPSPFPSPYEAPKTIEFNLRHYEAQKAAHYLTLVHGVAIRRAIPITAAPLVLGRDPSLSFHLPDADVSRSHCSLRVAGDSVLVSDLGSTNGTFVDGVRMTKERTLPVSSLLQVGRHAFKHELLRPDEVQRLEQLATELERARAYVQALIPSPLERGPLRTAWCFVPSSVLGGDALGYHELPGGRLAIYVLDTCGHGVASAMHSASVLNALRGQTLPDADFADPARVLGRLNEAFQMADHGGMYFSIFYGVIDAASRRMRYASAGHPPAIVLGEDGTIRGRLALRNPPIGTVERRVFAEAEAAFEPGDRLYAYSDGVYEIQDRNGRDLSLEDFERDVVASRTDGSGGDPARFYEAACATAGTDLLPDDFTILLVDHAPTAEDGRPKQERSPR